MLVRRNHNQLYHKVLLALFCLYFLLLLLFSLSYSASAQVAKKNSPTLVPDTTWKIQGDSLVPVLHPPGYLSRTHWQFFQFHQRVQVRDSLFKRTKGLPQSFNLKEI